MSSTRHAKEGAPLKQERYMSSPEFDRGLMGNLVARRCEVLNKPADRTVIWWLQLLSHQEGGLEAVAGELVRRYPERAATKVMAELGVRPGVRCNREAVEKIRTAVSLWFENEAGFQFEFPLKGDHDLGTLLMSSDEFREWERNDRRPESYDGGDFRKVCLRAAEDDLPAYLERLCLDPELTLEAGPYYFYRLPQALHDYMAAWIAERSAGRVVTEIGRQVNEALDYCLETGRMVLIDGLARTGKTHQVKAWCDQHPGQARYVQVPSTNDDIAFFRAIADGLGVASGTGFKATQLRQRIEDTLHRSKLVLVLDEGHYLWPQANRREALPSRLNWLMTACVNHGVPVAMITTPLFMSAQKRVEQKTGWTSEQFVGRIGLYHRLPDSLTEADLEAVARVQLPEGDEAILTALVKYATSSAKYLAGIDTVVTRARFLARRDDRAQVKRMDIKRAIEEGVIPSDNALSAALADTGKRGRKSFAPTAARPMQSPGMASANRNQDASEAPADEVEFPRRASTGPVRFTLDWEPKPELVVG